MSDVVLQNDVIENEPQQPKKKINWIEIGRALRTQSGWIWLIPALILLGMFTIYPIFNTLFSAFRENFKALSKTHDGFGFLNFKYVLEHDFFIRCLKNTFLFAIISVPVSTILALLLSVALASIKPLQRAYQSVFFLPYLTNSMSIGAVFKVMFDVIGTKRQLLNGLGSWGLINQLLGTEIIWTKAGAPIWAQMTVILLYEIWSGLPFKILILFGALQSVNKQYYDAAKVDGANKGRILWRITVPLLSPQIAYLVITGIIGGFKSYSAIVGIYGEKMGVTTYSMGTIVGLVYQFIYDGETGYAAACSLILFAIIMVITVINLFVSKKKVHY